jgi:hypothetical protein
LMKFNAELHLVNLVSAVILSMLRCWDVPFQLSDSVLNCLPRIQINITHKALGILLKLTLC